MGYERKRGKLADLNALLRGHGGEGGGDRFQRIVGDTGSLSAVRYVITLDTDTQLPRDAAREFVATMAHPLNRPVFGDRPLRGHRRRGLRHPAAARRPQPAEHQPLAATRACTAASPASIRTRARSPTSTRTCSAKARSSARASTTSTRSSARWPAACPRTASSATTCSKAATRAPAWSATCSCSRTTPTRYSVDVDAALPLDPRRLAAAALAAAAPAARCRARRAIRCRRCRARRSSTTCAAAWCRRRWSRCCWSAGALLPGPGLVDLARARDRRADPGWPRRSPTGCAAPPSALRAERAGARRVAGRSRRPACC